MEREYRIKESVYSDGVKKFEPEFKGGVPTNLEGQWYSLPMLLGDVNLKNMGFNYTDIEKSIDLIKWDIRCHEIPKVFYHTEITCSKDSWTSKMVEAEECDPKIDVKESDGNKKKKLKKDKKNRKCKKRGSPGFIFGGWDYV